MRFETSVLAALVACVLAAPTHVEHVLHEKRDVEATASNWVKRAAVPVGKELPVRIGLTQSNLDAGHNLLMEVAEHDSPKFGQHYTQDEIIDLFAPAKETVDSVREWLESQGISGVTQSVNKQWLQFDAAVQDVEALLRTKFYEFVHADSGNVHVACDEYHVPAHIQDHIDYITPGVVLKSIQHTRKIKRSLEKRGDFRFPPIIDTGADVSMPDALKVVTTCDYHITPGCVRRLYNITVGTTAVAGNELGIFEDLNDILDQKDLNTFWSTADPTIPKGTGPILHPIDGAPGPVNQSSGGGESVLDFELSIPIIYPQRTVLFQTDDAPTEEHYIYEGFLNNFFDAIDGSYCTYSAFGETGNSPVDPPYPDPKAGGYKGKLQCGKYKPTNVISISYGGGENDMPVNYQRRQCNEIMKLGMQGVSVVVASGDSGVSSGGPYITSLGATFLPYPRDANTDNEVAVERFGSGGGFSNIYPQPDYQKAAVQGYIHYFAPDLPAYQTLYNESSYNGSGFGANGGVYNSIGRAYPDFAASGDGILNVLNGAIIIEGGTSASSPIFASILTRINEARLLANKSTVGFVNPTLYAHPEVLHDITKGNNNACKGKGFKCAVGWDPVTGMGTPNFGLMRDLYLSLP